MSDELRSLNYYVKVITERATRAFTPGGTTQALLVGLSTAWPYGLLFLLALTFLWPAFFGGKLPFMRDMFFDFLPQHSFAKQVFWSGHIPLWSSHSGCGKPFIADPQTATFYPLHAAFYLFSAPMALRIYCATHLWLAGAAMFALARHWRMDVAPALVTALSCMFSSWVIANLEFANNLAAAVWAPLIVLTLSKVAQTLCKPDTPHRTAHLSKLTLAVALLLAVQYLAGFPEFLVYTIALAITYVLAMCAFDRAFRALVGTLAILALAGLLAILLTTPQLLLSMEFVPLSERAGEIDPGFHVASLQLHNLLQFILPFINGRPGYPDQFWAGTVFEFWIGTCYLGILPLVLAGFSVLAFRRSDARRQRKFLCAFLLAAVFLGILMALGENTPLYQFLYQTVPGFGHFRFPSKFLVLVLFAVSLLAGLGLQEILEICRSQVAGQRLRKCILTLGPVTIGIFLCGYFVAMSNSGLFRSVTNGLFPVSEPAYRSELHDYLLAIVFLIASFVVILALTLVRTLWTAWLAPALVFGNLVFTTSALHPMVDDKVYETRPDSVLSSVTDLTKWRVHSVYGWLQQWLYANRDETVLKWAVDAGVGDSWLPYGINQTSQGGQKLQRYAVLYSLLGSLPPPQADKLADLLSIRYLLTGGSFQEIYWRGGSRSLQLVERPSARTRAFLAGHWIRAARADDVKQAVTDILGKMLAPDSDAARTAIVEPAVSGESSVEPSIPEPIAAAESGAGQVYSVQDKINGVIVHVMAEKKALLVLNDAWYPGWIAFVDGIAQPVFRTNFDFRGVFLEPGEHDLHFVFAPRRFGVGLWIASLAAMLLGALAGLFNFLPKGPQRSNNPAS